MEKREIRTCRVLFMRSSAFPPEFVSLVKPCILLSFENIISRPEPVLRNARRRSRRPRVTATRTLPWHGARITAVNGDVTADKL